MNPIGTSHEIPREPDIPPLNEQAIEILSRLCFRENDPLTKSELLFVFGTRKNIPEASEQVKTALGAGITSHVLLTGGPTQGFDTPESLLLLETIEASRYPSVSFICESTSTNTKDNVANALNMYDYSKLGTITFIFKAYAAGRGYLTLRKWAPTSRILQFAYPVAYPASNGLLNEHTWSQTSTGIKRVWGEFQRIRLYGKRGDIEFEEVRTQVEAVEHILKLE